MAHSGHERRKQPRAQRTGGNVSRYAQRRVDMRVMEIMSRRDAAARRDSHDSHSYQPLMRPTRAAASSLGAER
jgi:hypothetical protein